MGKSILELVSRLLLVFPTIKDAWKGNVGFSREPYIYEHIFGPVVVMWLYMLFLKVAFLFDIFIPQVFDFILVSILIGTHLVLKELILDTKKWGFVDMAGVIERSFGLLLAGLVWFL